MPDRRSHRGPHPEDAGLFAPEHHQRLCRATADLCWLLSRGYAGQSALKLVGDRYCLVARQRTAIGRAACSRQEAARRAAHRIEPGGQRGRILWLDGYNVLTTIEAALAGGVILGCCDGTCRDMASMHGSYRKVAETLPALEIIGRVLDQLGPAECLWLLDRPVSNSARLGGLIAQVADEHGWPWRVELVPDPDPLLCDPAAGRPETTADETHALTGRGAADAEDSADRGKPGCGPRGRAGAQVIVASADSDILDHCPAWLNLARLIVSRCLSQAVVVDLAAEVEWG